MYLFLLSCLKTPLTNGVTFLSFFFSTYGLQEIRPHLTLRYLA